MARTVGSGDKIKSQIKEFPARKIRTPIFREKANENELAMQNGQLQCNGKPLTTEVDDWQVNSAGCVMEEISNLTEMEDDEESDDVRRRTKGNELIKEV